MGAVQVACPLQEEVGASKSTTADEGGTTTGHRQDEGSVFGHRRKGVEHLQRVAPVPNQRILAQVLHVRGVRMWSLNKGHLSHHHNGLGLFSGPYSFEFAIAFPPGGNAFFPGAHHLAVVEFHSGAG